MFGELRRPEPVDRMGFDWLVDLVRSTMADDEEIEDEEIDGEEIDGEHGDAGGGAGPLAGVAAEDLEAEVLACEALRRLLDAAEGRRLAELDRRDATARRHGLVTHRWLAREAMVPASVAKARVRVGTALAGRFGAVEAAVEGGRVSWEHARAIVDAANPRVLDEVAELQEGLVGLAQACVFERWRRELSGIVAMVDTDGGHDPAGDDERTTLRISPLLDGVATLSGVLAGEDAVVVHDTIEAIADELYRAARADHEACADVPIPSRAVLRARAMVEVCRRGRARPLTDTSPPRPEMVLVTEASDPLTRLATPDGVVVQDGTSRHLICDADWYAVVVDSLGVPLDHGRAVRFATAAQRRAVAVRDGGCVFPGCDAPVAWLDTHHVHPFDQGGATDTAQLCGLCRGHHRRVAHANGWSLQLTTDGWAWFTSPQGHTFWGQRHGHQRRGPTPDALATTDEPEAPDGPDAPAAPDPPDTG